MYIPEHFRLRHDADALTFMRSNPFAILISTTSDGPYATHLPLFVRTEGALQTEEQAVFSPWPCLKSESALAISRTTGAMYDHFSWFAFLRISPSNYIARESVPTWNYAAVHVYGNARLFSSEHDLHQMLDELMEILPSLRIASSGRV